MMLLLGMSHYDVFVSLLLLCCGYATLRGGAPERIAAAIVLIAFSLTWAVHGPWDDSFATLEHLILGIDTGMYVALLALSLCTQRFWPLWMSAIQGLTVLGHGVGLIGSQNFNVTYAIIVQVWSYPIVLILAVATLRHRLRVRLNGTDPAWSIAQYPWKNWKRNALVH